MPRADLEAIFDAVTDEELQAAKDQSEHLQSDDPCMMCPMHMVAYDD